MGGNLREQKKLQARQAIIKAAAGQFQKRGFSAASISGIMRAAHLAVGTFYNYFDSKEEVLVELTKKLREEIENEIKSKMTGNQTSLELLESHCLLTGKMLDENRFVLPLFMSAAVRFDQPSVISPERMSPGFKTFFDEIIFRGQERGEIRKDVPADLIAELFHSVYQAAVFSKLNLSFQENIKVKVKILIDGIKVSK